VMSKDDESELPVMREMALQDVLDAIEKGR
jgi:hypothetical protein